MEVKPHNHKATVRILIGMGFGVTLALLYKFILSTAGQSPSGVVYYLYGKGQWFDALGLTFMNLIKMLVMPIVFVSLVCGACDLKGMSDLGRIGSKTLGLYLLTTALAISLALLVASVLHIGVDVTHGVAGAAQQTKATPLSPMIIANFIPANVFQAFSNPKQMLQVVIFALLFGLMLPLAGKSGEKLIDIFRAINEVLMKFMHQIIRLSPYGVCFLLAYNFSHIPASTIVKLASYCLVLVGVLLLQLLGVYALFIWLLARLNPLTFLRKMFPAMLFAFSVSSSSASIPVVLDTVKKKLGVAPKIASFVIPVGATINMDGTAIMQGVATVFIMNYCGHSLGAGGYLIVVLLATLASIGTAAVPSAGLVTLMMILSRFLTPIEFSAGYALICMVDRLLDMLRTAVNVAGDSMVACVVARTEKQLDLGVYKDAN